MRSANGKSVATTMGMSPQSGLPQNNRVGDFDPFAMPVDHAANRQVAGRSAATIWPTQSGLLGLSGVSGDIRDLEAAAADGQPTRRSWRWTCYVAEIRRHLGGLLVELGGADVIVFTGGIGENGVGIRPRSCAGIWQRLGIRARSGRPITRQARGETRISAADSRTQIWVVPTNEELIVARQTRDLKLILQTKR